MSRFRRTVLVLASCLSMTSLSYAEQGYNNPPNLPAGSYVGTGKFDGQTSMNGYKLEQFGDFVNDWHFVTVRFRRDTGEMRLTYANDSAWKALKAGKGAYPDGATFIKIGIMAEEDPAFISSIAPAGAKRYQVMVKDSKKHTETDGWGYALFDINAKTFDIDPQGQTMACHACHRIVEDRGFVFSQGMNLDVNKPALMGIAHGMESGSMPPARLEFKTEDVKTLSKKIRDVLPAEFTQVRALQGELRGQIFQGTIDEIRPTLAAEAQKSGLPAILYDGDGVRFSIVFINPGRPDCAAPNGSFANNFIAPHTIQVPGDRTYPVKMIDFCQAPTIR